MNHLELANWSRPGLILLILFLAVLVNWFAHRLFDRLLRRTELGWDGEKLNTQANSRRRQRLHSAGSLVKSCLTGLILGTGILTILGILGLNLLPILASAGLLGLVLSFGIQTLIKDFFSGAFLIFEDQYSVGDQVVLNDVAGTVISVGLRVTQLQATDGTIWYVRNGEITKVGNHSQGETR